MSPLAESFWLGFLFGMMALALVDIGLMILTDHNRNKPVANDDVYDMTNHNRGAHNVEERCV